MYSKFESLVRYAVIGFGSNVIGQAIGIYSFSKEEAFLLVGLQVLVLFSMYLEGVKVGRKG